MSLRESILTEDGYLRGHGAFRLHEMKFGLGRRQ